MKHALPKLRAQIELLEAFAAKYDVGERGSVGILSAIYPDRPEVSFDATKHGAWVGDTFGAGDWETAPGQGYCRFRKLVDGVRVILNRAYDSTGEAGITLPPEFVKPLDVAARR